MALRGFEFVGVEHAGCFRVNCLQAFPVLAKGFVCLLFQGIAGCCLQVCCGTMVMCNCDDVHGSSKLCSRSRDPAGSAVYLAQLGVLSPWVCMLRGCIRRYSHTPILTRTKIEMLRSRALRCSPSLKSAGSCRTSSLAAGTSSTGLHTA